MFPDLSLIHILSSMATRSGEGLVNFAIRWPFFVIKISCLLAMDKYLPMFIFNLSLIHI